MSNILVTTNCIVGNYTFPVRRLTTCASRRKIKGELQISVSANGIQQQLPVRGNRIHLQQVIINLATNGMDAMADVAAGARKLDIQTALVGESSVEVSVSDSGTGIPARRSTKYLIPSTQQRNTVQDSDCQLPAQS